MKIFNGKLKLASVENNGVTVPVTAWTIVGKFTSNDGFVATDLKSGDILYINGYNIKDDSHQVCRYKVENINNVQDNLITCGISFAEDYTGGKPIYVPTAEAGYDLCVVGRMSSANGFTVIATADDGFAEGMLESVRNYDLVHRDEMYTKYITAYTDKLTKTVEKANNSLSAEGGIITGDLAVNGTTTLNDMIITAGTNKITLNERGIEANYSADNLMCQRNYSSNNDITAVDVMVSNNGGINKTVTASGLTARATYNVSGASASAMSTNIIATEYALFATTAKGNTAQVQINANGTSTSAISLDAKGVNGMINISANKVAVSGNVNTVGTIIANAMYVSDKSGKFDDNQLITFGATKTYVQDYVTKHGSPVSAEQITDMQHRLAAKANASEVYNKIQVDSALKAIPAANVITDDAHAFVTKAQCDAWSDKQDALGFTPINEAEIGVANGICPLGVGAKIDVKYIPNNISSGITALQNALGKKADKTDTITTAQLTDALHQIDPQWVKWSANYRSVTAAQITEWNAKQNALGFVPIDSAKVGIASGVCPLDTDGLVATKYLPATVVQSDSHSGVIKDTVLPHVGTAGSYANVKVDVYGRVVGGDTVDKVTYGATWHHNADGTIRWFGTGTGDVTIAKTAGKIEITVAKGVNLQTLWFAVATADFGSDANIAIDFDKTESWAFKDATAFGSYKGIVPAPIVTVHGTNYARVANKETFALTDYHIGTINLQAKEPCIIRMQW